MTDRDTLERIAAWTDTMRAVREERDELIVIARLEERRTLREIAVAARLTPMGVRKIIQRLEADEL